MAGNTKGKRAAPSSQVEQIKASSKKRKLNDGKQKSVKASVKSKSAEPKKEKAADRGVIPIPNLSDDDVEISDQDMDVLAEFGGAASFLKSLDKKGIMRSKKETQRLHELNKPVRKPEVYDDLPSIDSHDEDEESWDSNMEDEDSEILSDEDDNHSIVAYSDKTAGSDEEMPYEINPRRLRQEPAKPTEIQRLPIKLADGKIQRTGIKAVIPASQEDIPSEPEESDSEAEERETPRWRVEDVSTGARFGRPAVVDVLKTNSRKAKIDMAKDQIAAICQEILADPENNLGLLRRLHTFSLKTVVTPTHPDPVPNDPIIRKLAVLSQLAVFKDVIPGYRIRALTETEKAEKVSQMVARTRDWEQGLVTVYQSYLRLLEGELKSHSELADTALHCMCTLLKEVTHFNFRLNLMTCIVARLSKKSWDASSELCSQTLIQVFREDLTGAASLEIVRLVNRMIKERHFKVHPNALSCLLSLRLRTELGVRASNTHADKPEAKKPKSGKAQKQEKVHLSKKAKKAYKEQKEIDKELREAGAEVDKEERKTTQTETLKLLFALYFRILKNPTPTPLLPAALSGISRFAHLVNIDFFKDLMQVLKDLIAIEEEAAMAYADLDAAGIQSAFIFRQLSCIVTAFELLSGQGEALNMDLTDFVNTLYSILLPLSFSPEMNAQPSTSTTSSSSSLGPKVYHQSVVDILFRALHLIFFSRTSGSTAPPARAAAFSKRLLSGALHWPTPAALRALEFVHGLLAKDSKLEAMLATEDRIYNGVYRADVDDPQLCHPFESSFWELHALHGRHFDPRVRQAAGVLLNYSAS
ncbi:Nucleolar complex protein 3-like protein [Psilocybe cubensis]|uniref:Nucleolar complex-associated protein 3 n=2 Tax=Psilocybe cubensis TaxID=181762 RepID=A0A8H7Y5U4_PSICU|nr:Nucleolar complex protein 3-like protein [Psilocybe cubensis]KAH9484302.1 Nucleolar complex protein 3-like protein [Psilocybe cubensis]